MQDGKLKPETEAKVKLSAWLHSWGVGVYWEKQNRHGYEKFGVRGTGGQKPDLLLEPKGHPPVLVEVKPKHSNSTVYDASPQCIRYWRQHDDAQYHIPSQSRAVDPVGIVAATDASMLGRLFKSPPDNPVVEYGEGREKAIERGELPTIEFRMTEQFCRTLWRYAKASETERHTANIGVLLSTELDGETEKRPAVLWDTGSGQQWKEIA